ncbi:cobalt-precorrin-3B C(17)-methyltransferase, partial [Paenibacillus darwinianus]
EAAATADFVIALYNPRSGRRTRQIVETQRILLRHRSPDTPVGLVKSAYRDRQDITVTTLANMLEHDIGMLTTVIVGNSATFLYEGLIITPRGYQRKYTLDAEEQALKPHERLRVEQEPWSLSAREESLERGDSEDGGDVGYGRNVALAGNIGNVSVSGNFGKPHPAELAMEALRLLGMWRNAEGGSAATGAADAHQGDAGRSQARIFEVGVAPGIANKKFTNSQLSALARIAGDSGEMEYTPHHQVILRLPAERPEGIVAELKAEGLLVFPIGDVAQVKACDFCDLDKPDAIPVAEELNRLIGGRKTPKELKVALNGCGMACYGAVLEDIGIVYRKGAYDLFLGGKKIGRNAHAAQPVAEGISAEQLVATVERIFREYTENGHPNESFHKYFKRAKAVAGFPHREQPPAVAVDAVCGD